MNSLRTPKLAPAVSGQSSPGTQYYAGYSAEFVSDLITRLELDERSTVLDPWNGAGTTTTVARLRGLAAIGIDVNPALVIVSRARLFEPDRARDLVDALEKILADAEDHPEDHDPAEPLLMWFAPATARHIRSIERSAQRVLMNSSSRVDLMQPASVVGVSPLAAAFYVLLFELTRSYLGNFRTTNPTWVKRATGGPRVSVGLDRMAGRLRTLCSQATNQGVVRSDAHPDRARWSDVQLKVGLSHTTGLAADSIDAVITSPPYCTRIDYAMLSRPELAILGVGDDDRFRALRELMIGTPTVTKEEASPRPEWGRTALKFLEAVNVHGSKAASGYYAKYYLQYFDSMYRSLLELRRVTKTGSPTALVVQDSYFKEIRVDLAGAMLDIAREIGWESFEHVDFPVLRTRSNMHPATRKYRNPVKAVESLVVFR